MVSDHLVVIGVLTFASDVKVLCKVHRKTLDMRRFVSHPKQVEAQKRQSALFKYVPWMVLQKYNMHYLRLSMPRRGVEFIKVYSQ